MSGLCSKYKRKTKERVALLTVEDKVADRKWPRGGLEEVETAVMGDYERTIAVDMQSLVTASDKKAFYLLYVSILMTAICVRVSQGRMQVPFYAYILKFRHDR